MPARLFAAFLVLFLPLLSYAQCTISWPARPAGEQVTSYTLYADGVVQATLLAGTPVTFLDVGLDEAQAYSLQVSATNATGEGPLSAAYQYTPPLPLPGQVGTPSVSACP